MYKDIVYPADRAEFYRTLYNEVKLYTADSEDFISRLSNASAVLKIAFPKANWAGFYLEKDGKLVLGPFQGRPAVTVIEKGKGVCGAAWERGEAIVVEEVSCFEGHIACDCNTHSEIVLPIYRGEKFVGVLDMDSVEPAYFTEFDREGLKQILDLINK